MKTERKMKAIKEDKVCNDHPQTGQNQLKLQTTGQNFYGYSWFPEDLLTCPLPPPSGQKYIKIQQADFQSSEDEPFEF